MISLLAFMLACGPKEEKPKPPPIGWHQEETWSHSCFHPKKFEDLLPLDRQAERELALDEMVKQWKGEKGDGISIEEKWVTEVEDTILAEMVKVEKVARENLAKCKQSATGKLQKSDWKSWVIKLPKNLTVGECNTHFTNTVLDYVEIDIPWSPADPLPICRGDQIVISSSDTDKYRISDNGPWINVLGDTNQSADGSDLPCNTEGCLKGMLIMKFVSLDGDEEVIPVGKRLEFTAPADGRITYGINDDSWFDNAWFVANGLQDHASITVAPAD